MMSRMYASWKALTLCALLTSCDAQAAQDDEALYPIVERSRYGFMDAAGHVVIAPAYDGAQISSEGLAAVRIGDGWGFINRADSMVIGARFAAVFPFKEGRGRVRRGAQWGFIDHAGAYVTEEAYTSALDFAQGRW